MRRIAIVGAGQSGLQLGLGLLDTGYDVTMITNRTADEIRQGKVMSSQCMFHTALQTERDLGLNFWEEQCPAVEGIGLALVNPENGGKAFEWSARLERYAQSVDQRVKMPYWMEEFERRGGRLVIQDVGIEELENSQTTTSLYYSPLVKVKLLNSLNVMMYEVFLINRSALWL